MDFKLVSYCLYLYVFFIFLLFLLKVLGFFDQDFMPQCCGCGEVVSFHVSSLLNYLLAKGCEEAVGVTEFAIQHYIKSVEIGCVGRQVKFRNGHGQVSAAHMRRNWFVESNINKLDACKYIFI